MQELAACAQAGREALLRGDMARLGGLMNRNFDLRLGLFGEAALGEHTVALVQIGRSVGCPTKLPGSGGAALILLESRQAGKELVQRYAASGYRFTPVEAL